MSGVIPVFLNGPDVPMNWMMRVKASDKSFDMADCCHIIQTRRGYTGVLYLTLPRGLEAPLLLLLFPSLQRPSHRRGLHPPFHSFRSHLPSPLSACHSAAHRPSSFPCKLTAFVSDSCLTLILHISVDPPQARSHISLTPDGRTDGRPRT